MAEINRRSPFSLSVAYDLCALDQLNNEPLIKKDFQGKVVGNNYDLVRKAKNKYQSLKEELGYTYGLARLVCPFVLAAHRVFLREVHKS